MRFGLKNRSEALAELALKVLSETEALELGIQRGGVLDMEAYKVYVTLQQRGINLPASLNPALFHWLARGHQSTYHLLILEQPECLVSLLETY